MDNFQTSYGEPEPSIGLLPKDSNIKSQATFHLQATDSPARSEVNGWPNQPKKLKESATALPLRLLSQALIAFVPACFILLGVLVYLANGCYEADFGNAVKQATQVASSLWPIAFAAVMGPMLKAVALYRAERGAKLGTIEMFSQSQTLVSTLKECYNLRILGLWTFLLVGLWSFSPAGGQAVLRLLTLEDDYLSASVDLAYYPRYDLSWSAGNNGLSGATSQRVYWQMLLGTALSAPGAEVLLANGSSEGFLDAVDRLSLPAAISGTRQDMWGNVRIPTLHLLPGYDENSAEQWIDVPSDSIVEVESLVGVPIRGIKTDAIGNVTFEISASYNLFECSPWRNLTRWLEDNTTQLFAHKYRNISIFTEFRPEFGTSPSIFLDLLDDGKNTTDPSTDTLILGAHTQDSNFNGFMNMTLCSVNPNHVDVSVECFRSNEQGQLSCAAKKVRRKPDAANTSSETEDGLKDWAIQGRALIYMVYILASSHPATASPLEMFLQDPTMTFASNIGALPDYSKVAMPVFSARLSMLINTFWYLTLNTTHFVGIDQNGPSNEDVDFLKWDNTTGNWTTPFVPVYHVHRRWMLLYVVATAVLSSAALVTIVLQWLTRAPDILCSVSTLTRDSPYVAAVPPGGSGLESGERARLLRDVWVRIQDVQPGKDVGRIAFSDNRELGARLKWNRFYE